MDRVQLRQPAPQGAAQAGPPGHVDNFHNQHRNRSSSIAKCVRQAGPCQPLARIFIDDRQRGAWDDDQLTSSFHPSSHVSCTACSAP